MSETRTIFKLCIEEPIVVLRAMHWRGARSISYSETVWFSYVVLPRGYP
jgi:hypothetical protein